MKKKPGFKEKLLLTAKVVGNLALLSVFVGALLWFYADYVWDYPVRTENNRFGDSYFGLASAALTGLAFAGSIYAIYLQRETIDQTVRDLEQSNLDGVYRDLDRAYQDLLRAALRKPYLRNKATITELHGHKLDEYQIYAYMVWNFVETIIDKADDEELRKTWGPAIREEQRLHQAWLKAPENAGKFRNTLADDIEEYVGKFELMEQTLPIRPAKRTEQAGLS